MGGGTENGWGEKERGREGGGVENDLRKEGAEHTGTQEREKEKEYLGHCKFVVAQKRRRRRLRPTALQK